MAGRRIPKEVQALFAKYQKTQTRRLLKEDALHLLEDEFGLEAAQATQLFDTFDKDQNGYMSLWEFVQFYQIIGNTAREMVAKFQELDADGSGKLDVEEARAGLHNLVTGDGEHLKEGEIDFFIKSTLGDDNMIDLGHFATILYRLRVHKKQNKK